MTYTPDAARAAGKTGALRALVSMAADAGWAVALYDASGHLLAPEAGGPAALLDADATRPGEHREPVRALSEVVGHVLARRAGAAGDAGAEEGGRRVAERVAIVLSDLCRQELEVVDLAREIAGAYEELNLFYDLTTALAGAREPRVICDAVLERALRVCPSRAGRMVLRDDRGELSVEASRGDRAHVAAVGTGSVAERCVGSGASTLTDLAGERGQEPLDGWERGAGRSLAAVPVRVLSGEDVEVIGVLELRDRLDADGGSLAPFTSGDVKLAQALADQAALLIDNARLAAYERELQLACQIQQSLLPGAPPDVPGLDIAAACISAHDVGGDYYDFLVTEGSELEVVIADVSGHHLAAALLQTAARATFRAAALRGEGPARTLEIGNHALMDDLARSDHFLTAWIAHIDTVTWDLEYESAGHPAALLWRAAGATVEDLEGGGLPVGVLHRGGYRDRRSRLEPGDVLLLHTDGLFEARGADGTLFGLDRLREALAAAASGPASDIVSELLAAVEAHAPRAMDDRTLVVLKRSAADSR